MLTHDSDKHVDLVLEGGGVKNIALLGAVLALSEAGYTFPRVAGTSGGAIIAAAVAAYERAGLDLGGLVDAMKAVDNKRVTAHRRPGADARPPFRALGPVAPRRPPPRPHINPDPGPAPRR